MSTSSLRRTIVLLLLVTFLAIPVSAAGHRSEGPRPAKAAVRIAPLEPLGRIWQLLRTVWTKEGCQIDPSGRCFTDSAEQPPANQVDTGCAIDPDGRCHS